MMAIREEMELVAVTVWLVFLELKALMVLKANIPMVSGFQEFKAQWMVRLTASEAAALAPPPFG